MKTKDLDIYAIRGLMIIWVIIVHISLDYGFISDSIPMKRSNPFLWMSFYMFPFYFFSGYYFKPGKKTKEVIKKKIKSLLLPYLVFSLLGVVVYELYCLVDVGHLGGISYVSVFRLACLPTNAPMWFFVSLFCVSVLYNLADEFDNRLLRSLGGVKICLSFTCLLFALLVCNRRQIFGWGNIALGISIYSAGYYFSMIKNQIDRKVLMVIASILIILIQGLYPCQLDFCVLRLAQGNLIIDYIYGLSACCLLWALVKSCDSKIWEKRGISFLVFIGESSLVVFATHRPFLWYLIEPLLNRFLDVPYFAYLIICYISVIVISLVINIIMRKYFPKLIGI